MSKIEEFMSSSSDLSLSRSQLIVIPSTEEIYSPNRYYAFDLTYNVILSSGLPLYDEVKGFQLKSLVAKIMIIVLPVIATLDLAITLIRFPLTFLGRLFYNPQQNTSSYSTEVVVEDDNTPPAPPTATPISLLGNKPQTNKESDIVVSQFAPPPPTAPPPLPEFFIPSSRDSTSKQHALEIPNPPSSLNTQPSKIQAFQDVLSQINKLGENNQSSVKTLKKTSDIVVSQFAPPPPTAPPPLPEFFIPSSRDSTSKQHANDASIAHATANASLRRKSSSCSSEGSQSQEHHPSIGIASAQTLSAASFQSPSPKATNHNLQSDSNRTLTQTHSPQKQNDNQVHNNQITSASSASAGLPSNNPNDASSSNTTPRRGSVFKLKQKFEGLEKTNE
jgi:hypothetical protein